VKLGKNARDIYATLSKTYGGEAMKVSFSGINSSKRGRQ